MKLYLPATGVSALPRSRILDRVFITCVPGFFLAVFSYIHRTLWNDNLFGIFGLLIPNLLVIYSVITFYRADHSSMAKIVRAMTGLVILSGITLICYMICMPVRHMRFQSPIHIRVGVLTLYLILAYMTHRVLMRQVGVFRLIVAAGLNMILICGWLRYAPPIVTGPGWGPNDF